VDKKYLSFVVTGSFGRRREPTGDVRRYTVEDVISLPFMPLIGTLLMLVGQEEEPNPDPNIPIETADALMRVTLVGWEPDEDRGFLHTEEFWTDPYHQTQILDGLNR
jgi:hypothetical protein